MIEMELQGFDEAVKMFQRLGDEGEQALYKSMIETAIEATTEMKINSPVVTNRLRSSIHWETPSTKAYLYKDSQGKGFTGQFGFRPSGLSVAWGTNVDYADAANQFSSKPEFFEKSEKRALIVLPQRLAKNYQKAVEKILK